MDRKKRIKADIRNKKLSYGGTWLLLVLLPIGYYYIWEITSAKTMLALTALTVLTLILAVSAIIVLYGFLPGIVALEEELEYIEWQDKERMIGKINKTA